jgi:hypothetical protein
MSSSDVANLTGYIQNPGDADNAGDSVAISPATIGGLAPRLLFSLVDNIATLSIFGASWTATGIAIVYPLAIPMRFRPSVVAVEAIYPLTNNGTRTSGLLRITPAGALELSSGIGTGAVFTGACNIGSVSVSYAL